MRLSVVAGLFSICVTAGSVAAQGLTLTPPSTATDRRLALSTGTVVHARNFVIFEKRGDARSPKPPASLTIYVDSPTPAADSARLAPEAREVAAAFDEFARTKAIGQIDVAICRTQACVERREAPAQSFWFARARDGKWVVEKNQGVLKR